METSRSLSYSPTRKGPAMGLASGRLAPAAVCLVAFAAGTAPAATPSDESGLFGDLSTVTGASRFEQDIGNAPSSVTIVTAHDIERFGYRTLGDILGSVRGFSVAGDRNYSYLGVRGFARAGDYNSRVVVLLDGRRVNDNVYQDVGYGEDGIIDVALIERVEVIRGPASSLYGSSAFFATVNIVTRRGRDIGGVDASVGAGSRHAFDARVTWGRRLETGLEYLFSLYGFATRGAERLYYPEFDSAATDFGAVRNADGENARRLFGKLRFGSMTLSAAWSDRVKTVPTAAWNTVFGDTGFRTRDERWLIEARYDAAWSSATDVQARISWNGMDATGTYPVDFPPIAKNYDRAGGRWWSAEAHAVTRAAQAHRVTFGGELQLDTRIAQHNEDIVERLRDRRRGSMFGAFVQDEWTVSDRVRVNAGLRHDRYSTLGSTTNPRLGVMLAAGAHTTVKLLAGRAYRAPNAYELYYTDGNVTQMANPALRPETIQTREIVLEHQPSRSLRLSATGYRYVVGDFIRQVIDAPTGLQVFRNSEPLRVNGLEFEAHWRDERGTDARLSWTHHRVREPVNGARLAGSPDWTARLQFATPIDGERSTLALAARFSGSRSTRQGGEIPAYGVADLTLRVALPGSPRSRVSASLTDVFDRRVADPGALEHTQDRIEQNGRTLWVRYEHGF